MNDIRRLSKSRFLSGYQCKLRLWNEFHAPVPAADASTSQRAVFRTGQQVGELACKRYPDGFLVGHDYRHFNDALAETDESLKEDTAPVLFEAAFEFDGLIARADIIERISEGGWRLIEVKATTRVKEIHKLDFAFQTYILQNAGLDVREGGVMILNKEYVYDGETLDLDELFHLHDLIGYADEMACDIAKLAHELQSTIAQEEPPDIQPGAHCFDPYACPYYENCTQDLRFPEHGMKELGRLSEKLREEIHEQSIEEIRDIPTDFSLNKGQRIIRRAVVEDRPIVHFKRLAAIDAIERPIHHLDFETFSPAIPLFAGTRPYETIPFLFSLHTEQEDREDDHLDYLHEGSDDPRPQLSAQLVRAVGTKGAICTYSKYERTIINNLADANPEHAMELRSIADRLVDLLELVRRAYYHPDFQGSFSLKRVLPVLCPKLGYADLEIADGFTAGMQYMIALQTEDEEQRNSVFRGLREYCKRDTLATLEIRQVLAEIVQSKSWL